MEEPKRLSTDDLIDQTASSVAGPVAEQDGATSKLQIADAGPRSAAAPPTGDGASRTVSLLSLQRAAGNRAVTVNSVVAPQGRARPTAPAVQRLNIADEHEEREIPESELRPKADDSDLLADAGAAAAGASGSGAAAAGAAAETEGAGPKGGSGTQEDSGVTDDASPVKAGHIRERGAVARPMPPTTAIFLQRSVGNRAAVIVNRFAAPPVPETDPFASPPASPQIDGAASPPGDDPSSDITSAPSEVEDARPSSDGGVVDTVKEMAMRALMSVFSAATGGTSSMAGSVVSTLAGVDSKRGEASAEKQQRTSEAQDASDTAASSASSAAASGRGLLRAGLSGIFGTATGLVDGLKGSVRAKADELAHSEEKPNFDAEMSAMKPPGLDPLGEQAQSLGDSTTGSIRTAVDSATSVLQAAGTAITGGLRSVIGTISSFGTSAESQVTSKTTANTSSVKSRIGGLPDVVLPLGRPILDAVRRVGAKIRAAAVRAIAAGIRWVVDELTRLLSTIASAIVSAVSWLVNGILRVITALFRAIIAAVRFLVTLPGRVWKWLTLIARWAKRTWAWRKRQDALDFMKKSFGPEPFVPSTNIGGFDAGYKGGTLTIGLKGGVHFKPSIVMSGDTAVPARPQKSISKEAERINKLKPADRPAEVAAWQWTEKQEEKFIGDFKKSVEDVWEEPFNFHVEKDYWNDVAAVVDVAVDIRKGDKGKNDHMQLTVFQVPTGGGAGGAHVQSNAPASATDNEMVVESDDVDQGTSPFLSKQIGFGPGSDTPTNPDLLKKIGKTFIPARSCGVCGKEITARDVNQFISVSVQGEGPDPEALAKKRFAKIKAHLVDAVSTTGGGSIFFVHDKTVGTTATVTVGNGVKQNTAAHEAGHMFGLSDEYTDAPDTLVPKGSGEKEGTKARHDQLAREMGVDEGAIYENSDNIMSLGNVVRPQHYATFWEALKTITGNDDWRIGDPTPVDMPPKPGPFPRFPGR